MDDWTGHFDFAANRAVIERIAVALGLANILFLIRRSLLNYPFGIAMVSLYAWIFFEEKLYSDALLQVFFLFIQIYGWMNWRSARDEAGLARIVKARRDEALGLFVAAMTGTLALGGVMALFTDAAFPFWDASIAVFSVIAQIMMAQRKLENWIVWIIVDALAIGLYWTKDLHATALLYGAFLVLSAMGYWSWRRAMPNANGAAA
jgi:nicotinamide mononucleotide transporter